MKQIHACSGTERTFKTLFFALVYKATLELQHERYICGGLFHSTASTLMSCGHVNLFMFHQADANLGRLVLEKAQVWWTDSLVAIAVAHTLACNFAIRNMGTTKCRHLCNRTPTVLYMTTVIWQSMALWQTIWETTCDSRQPSLPPFRVSMRKHNLEIQTWNYEITNNFLQHLFFGDT